MRRRMLWVSCLAALSIPVALSAQDVPRPATWGLRIRGVMSGTSYDSEPAGYKIYSGVALNASVVRTLGSRAAVELSLRTESREVEGPRGPGLEHRLGSFEMMPVDLLVQWHPLGRGDSRFQPYLGVGVDVTTTWEASGVLDSTHPPVNVGPALQIGVERTLTSRAVLSLDVKWTTMSVEFENFGATIPRVKVDPLALGLGIGVSL